MARKSKYEQNDTKKAKEFKVAGYVRLSVENNDGTSNESTSISNQKELIELNLKKLSNYQFVGFYIDDGYTGTNFDRPGFKNLLEDIKDGKVNTIIVKDISRIGRNYIEVGNYLYNFFPLYNIRVISINENIDTLHNPDAIASTLVGIKNIMNDDYCRDIGKKIRSAVRAKKLSGEYLGLAPYGYLIDPENKHHLIIDKEVEPVIKRIFQLKLDNTSVARIASTLTKEGIDAPQVHIRKLKDKESNNSFNNYWRPGTVRHMLKNQFYCGDCVQGKTIKPNYKSKHTKALPKDKWIIVKDTHEAIIDRETFNKVQQTFIPVNNKRRKYRTLYTGYSSEGLIKCADCHMTMQVFGFNSKTNAGNWYCNTYRESKRNLCSRHGIGCKDLDKAVLDTIKLQISLVIDMKNTLKEISKSSLEAERQKDLNNSIKKIQDKIKKNNDLKKRTYEDWKLNIINDSDFNELKSTYDNKIKALNEKLNVLENSKINEVESLKAKWISNFTKYKNIQSLNREVISNLIERIYVYEGKRITIVFKYEDEYLNTINFIKERSFNNE